ncbi:MAG TPA: flagellar hook-length control protein FliK [Nocardioides sp.]|uniref:flagellar hook-length control protein FliK n=1 Tax=Nocardioides sp. TaxID=35761 RepID=UPI002BE59851|nr:flagellar hook-length control protein FliK [Nocardioides sp.]HTW13770.1 flagellar hook-length control protein FliK [Nocardioides sp.]
MATVTATPSAGRTAGQPGPAGAGDATGDTGFGDLLAALVPGNPADLTPATSTPPGVCGAGPEVLVQQEDAVVGAADSAPVVVGAAEDGTPGSRTGDPGGVVPAVDGAPEAAEGVVPAEVLPDADPVPTADAALLAQAQLAALPLLTPVVAVPVADTAVDASATVVEPSLDTTAAPAGGDTADGLPDVAGAVPGPSTTDAGGGDQPADQQGDRPTGPAATPTAAPATTGSAPAADTPTPVAVVGPGTVTAPAPAAAAATARPADAVPGQVFPEVVRLSQAGPGTHRVTLRLDPGTLGEVRVTLTVRDGEVQVRLAAQHDAREVLALAAPDLRRLLEQPGIEARVSVADLTSGTTTATSTDQGGDGPFGGGRGTGADPDPGRPGGPYDQQPRRTPTPATGAMPGTETATPTHARSGLDLAL